MYKKVSTSTRPLPLKITSEDFAEEWLKCVSNKSADLSKLLEMMHPVFDTWRKQILLKEGIDEINFTTLCRLLSLKPSKALEKIDLWANWVENNSSIINELQYIFLERIRKFKYKPSSAKPIMIEYIVARDFKLGIYHHMRKILRLINRDAIYNLEDKYDFEIAITFKTPDYLLLKNIGLTPWQSYLFYLLKQGYSSTARSKLTKLHRRNLHKEEKQIWLLLKRKQ